MTEMSGEAGGEQMNYWTNRLLFTVILLTSTSVGLELAILYRVLPQHSAPSEVAQRISGNPAPAEAKKSIGMTVDISGLPIQGDGRAKIAIVEFSDFECPFCAAYADRTWPQVRKQLVEKGRVRYAAANFPLTDHRNAKRLATAAICAGRQGHYWPMHDELFRKTPPSAETIAQLAHQLSLDILPFNDCLAGAQANDQIQHDLDIAKRLDLRATPTFLIGTIDDGIHLNVNTVIVGAQPFAAFEASIRDVKQGEKSN